MKMFEYRIRQDSPRRTRQDHFIELIDLQGQYYYLRLADYKIPVEISKRMYRLRRILQLNISDFVVVDKCDLVYKFDVITVNF